VHALSDGEVRLREWITFHLLAGFDHIYIYDNSKAFASNSSLAHVVEEFSSDAVTHIDWPCKVCNNLKPAFYDPGERSSQVRFHMKLYICIHIYIIYIYIVGL